MRYSDNWISDSIELYKIHKNYKKVCELQGISPGTLGKWLKKANIPTKRRYSNKFTRECVALYKILKNKKKVAKMQSISQNMLNSWLNKEKIDMKLQKLVVIAKKQSQTMDDVVNQVMYDLQSKNN